MATLIFKEDMPIYKHGENEPFKVDIVKGAKYEVDGDESKLLVFGYCDWMSGTLVMDVKSIIDNGFAVIIKE